jgi:anthraniloyl-CoA monooxygenase
VRILTIGAGPGGLLFALLAKRDRPADDVVIFERNTAEATFGFGVVFSARALGDLERADPEMYRAIGKALVRWDAIEVRRGANAVRCGGHAFSAIARARLLQILRDRAVAVGVRLEYGREFSDPGLFAGFDLVVAADGVKSFVRERYAAQYEPTVETGLASYIWLATPHRFDALTLIFERNEAGAFAAHAYPFDDERSTFIVETDADTLKRAGLEEDVEGLGEAPASRVYLEAVFARHLGGAPLLSNRSRWQTFPTVTNATWRAGNMVLVGDAAHTAHFSLGSGTRMAFEDALALSAVLREMSDLPRALGAYEARRRPEVERLQRASAPSRRWFETFSRTMRLAPEPFALHCITRTGLVTAAGLRRRDAGFMDRVEAAFVGADSGALVGRGGRSLSPLAVQFSLRGLMLANRWVRAASGSLPLADGLVPGLAMVSRWPGNGSAQASGSAPLGLELTGVDSDCRSRAALAASQGFALLSLVAAPPSIGSEGGRRKIVELVRSAREAWPTARPLAVRLSFGDSDVASAWVVDFARDLRSAGCDLVAISAPALPEAVMGCDAVRNGADVPTILVGDVAGADEANTLLLSGRIDLVCPVLEGLGR